MTARLLRDEISPLVADLVRDKGPYPGEGEVRWLVETPPDVTPPVTETV